VQTATTTVYVIFIYAVLHHQHNRITVFPYRYIDVGCIVLLCMFAASVELRNNQH